MRPIPIYLAMKGSTWFFFYMVFALAAIYRIEEGGFDPLQLVLAGTVMELATFFFEVPTGVIADVHSRRLSMVLGHVVMGGAFLLEGLWPSVGPILLAQCIFGLGYTLISGAEDAWLADEIGEERFPQVLLRGTQCEQIGSFMGIGAAVALASFDLSWPFLVAGVGLCVQALLMWCWMPENGFRGRAEAAEGDPSKEGLSDGWGDLWQTFRQGVGFTRQRPFLMTLMAIALCYGLASEGIDRLWEAHLLENFDFPTWGGLSNLVWLGIISASFMLCTFVATEWVQRFLSRPMAKGDLSSGVAAGEPGGIAPRRLILLLVAQSVLVVAGLVVFALSDNFLWAVSIFVAVNVLRRVARPLFLACVNRGLDPSVRATVLSTVNQMSAFGEVSGGPLVGAVGVRWGLRIALLTVAALLTPVWGLYRRAIRQIATD